ncbi:hypothetical protein LRS10_03600 [Phenylobacterium sp. J426]|uniref:hypothetical protein n=1 Tax=Phenylobacterium sp. J426 TaxID=2898439 RepID=UPI002151CD08|nr:hypothetical protein [Phenylobacterium sp. J426]MCR5873356.1 hypothetical protein [Phenylobacterium sp. J426]
MKRLDLDDLPPNAAAVLKGLEVGEELLLVQHGARVGRLAAVGAPLLPTEPELPPEQNAREVFEAFRSAIEDEF